MNRKTALPLNEIKNPELQPMRLHGLAQDLTGKTFGRLTAIWPLGKSTHGNGTAWLCLCAHCQKLTIVPTFRLNNGNTQSCGCLQRDRSREFVTALNQRKAAERARRTVERS